MPLAETVGDRGASDTSMSEGDHGGRSGPIDSNVLERIAQRLAGSSRFSAVVPEPKYAPNSVVADYDTGYFPPDVTRAYLRIR